MRGKVKYKQDNGDIAGITPAYAGKSQILIQPGFTHRDHPRVCGEKALAVLTAMTASGSPPRMRGKGDATTVAEMGRWITPAYAGKRNWYSRQTRLCGDHPRVCGEK